MTDLAVFLGALMTSFAQARRIADEESAAIAEYYRDHPLLRGMAAPRLRLPEIDVEIPVVIDEVVAATAAQPAAPKDVAAKVSESIKSAGAPLSAAALKRVSATVETRLADAATRLFPGGSGLSELTARIAEDAVASEMTATDGDGRSARDAALSAARAAALSSAVLKPGIASHLRVSALTSAVKDMGGPGRVATIRLKLTEEGLEWASDRNADGTSTHRLVPE